MKKQKKENSKKNLKKIPLLNIYKQDGMIYAEEVEKVNEYELWGFLKILVKMKEEMFVDDMFDNLKELD